MGYKIRVSSRAVVIHDNKILLNCFGDGLYYNFPGGGIEENETALEAVVREVYEESGIEIKVDEHVFTFEYEPSHCNNLDGNSHHISLFFLCTVVGNPDIALPIVPDANPDDSTIMSKAKWVPISQLNDTPFVPISIYDSLMEYIKTGIFKPSFVEHSNPV